MHLSQLSVRNFRSLHAAEISLKPLTLVIGPNGSGKTNLFKALRFLHDAVAGDAREWKSYESQIDDLLWYGREESWLKFSMMFAGGRIPLAKYRCAFKAGDFLEVAEEELNFGQEGFKRQGERVVQSWDGKREAAARSANILTLRDEGPSVKSYSLVYRHISGWRFFEIDPKLARAGHFVPEDPKEVPPLEADGANLSAFLYGLQRLRPEDLDAVTEAVGRSIELPERVLVEHDAERGGSQARYWFTEAPFGDRLVPPESMSDGTIRLLAHLALLLADRSVPFACLEEPDSGLHPKLMLPLADALRQAVQIETVDGTERQVLVTTHSPELMDCFDLAGEKDYLQVYVTERDETGRTRFVPVTAVEFAPWLERYRLGEAVRRRFV
jgi:predicted ATPase